MQDAAGYPLTVVASSIKPATGLTVVADQAGGFTAIGSQRRDPTPSPTWRRTRRARSALPVTATVTSSRRFRTDCPPCGWQDGSCRRVRSATTAGSSKKIGRSTSIPTAQPNPPHGAVSHGARTQLPAIVPILGANFHTSDMPFVAQGCTGPNFVRTGQTVSRAQSRGLRRGQRRLPA